MKSSLIGPLGRPASQPSDSKDRQIAALQAKLMQKHEVISELMEENVNVKQLLKWAGLATSKYHTWKNRYGKANEHNGKIPRDWWIEPWEKQAIIDYHDQNPLEGYRRLTFMMLDDDIVAVSPSTTYRVLKSAGRLDRKPVGVSKKGTGFVQPEAPHKHWHTDISYLNLGGTFYFLISVLDGMSRYIVHWEISADGAECPSRSI